MKKKILAQEPVTGKQKIYGSADVIAEITGLSIPVIRNACNSFDDPLININGTEYILDYLLKPARYEY